MTFGYKAYGLNGKLNYRWYADGRVEAEGISYAYQRAVEECYAQLKGRGSGPYSISRIELWRITPYEQD